MDGDNGAAIGRSFYKPTRNGARCKEATIEEGQSDIQVPVRYRKATLTAMLQPTCKFWDTIQQ